MDPPVDKLYAFMILTIFAQDSVLDIGLDSENVSECFLKMKMIHCSSHHLINKCVH